MPTKAEEYVQRMKVAADHYNAAVDTRPSWKGDNDRAWAYVDRLTGNLVFEQPYKSTEGPFHIPAADVPDFARWCVEVWG